MTTTSQHPHGGRCATASTEVMRIASDEPRRFTAQTVQDERDPGSRRSAPAAGAPVSCRNLWKIFGPDPRKLLESSDARLPRSEMREKTGCVAAVRDVSFDVAPAEIFVVMGLSGSGKSTLIRCLSRLIEPTAGTVMMAGRDVLAALPAELRDLVAFALVAGVLGIFFPGVAAVGTGFAIAAALTLRAWGRAVAAIEERDGVRFYVEPGSALGPVSLVRTPGLRKGRPPGGHQPEPPPA